MIQITRLFARQVTSIVRRALRVRPSLATAFPVRLVAGPGGLRLTAQNLHHHGVEFLDAEPAEPEEITVPLELFQAVAGKRPEPVALTSLDDGKRVEAQWREGPIPTTRCFDVPQGKVPSMPALPEDFVANSSALWRALRAAHERTDSQSSRYALSCVRLHGADGSIAATNTRELLLQRGFQLGFIEVLLLPTSPVFACPELEGDHPVLVGKSGEYVALRRGLWTFLFRLETQARFPNVEEVIPSEAQVTTRLTLAPADVAFVRENLRRLPGAEQDSSPVTLDLNGTIAIRARGEEKSPPTELRLTHSTKTGSDLQLQVNRQLLGRALELGLSEFWFFGADGAVQCRDANRSYVWLPLGPQGAIPASPEAIVILSTAATADHASAWRAAKPSIPSEPQENPVSETTSPPVAEKPAPARTTPSAKRRRSQVARAQAELLEQSYRLRAHLREGLVQLRDLIGVIKRQRRQERLVQSTLESLKQLQAA